MRPRPSYARHVPKKLAPVLTLPLQARQAIFPHTFVR